MLRSLLAAGAVALTGPLTIGSQDGTQPGSIGPVQVTIAGTVGSSLLPSAQQMVAVRTPAGLTLPATLTMTGDGGPYTLTANDSYSSALQAVDAKDGQEWHGYATSAAIAPATGTTFAVPVTVPLPAGTPYTGPLTLRLVTGYRSVVPPGNPFDCGITALTTTCEASSADKDYATRDLAVAAGDAATGEAGSTAAVVFGVKYRGATGPAFTQTAATTVPGAAAKPKNGTITPGTDEDRSETVDVTIPAGTTPGDYTVTLTDATGGQTRSGTATLKVTPSTKPEKTTTPTPTATVKPTVTAAPTAQPTPFAKVPPKSFTASAKPRRDRFRPYRFTVKGRLGLPAGVGQDGVTCAGTVKVIARRFGISVGSRTTTVAPSCAYRVTVTVKKTGRIRVETRFAGNAVFTPKSAKALRVRTG